MIVALTFLLLSFAFVSSGLLICLLAEFIIQRCFIFRIPLTQDRSLKFPGFSSIVLVFQLFSILDPSAQYPSNNMHLYSSLVIPRTSGVIPPPTTRRHLCITWTTIPQRFRAPKLPEYPKSATRTCHIHDPHVSSEAVSVGPCKHGETKRPIAP